MEETPKNEPWWKPAFEIFGRVSVWVIVPIVAALIAGKWLDARYGTSPWAFLSLSGIGFLMSSFGIVYTVRDYINKMDEEIKIKSLPKQKQNNDNRSKTE